MGRARNGWLFALRGGLAVLFGVLVFLWPWFLWPELGWFTVVLMFAVYSLADGVLAVAAGVVGHVREGRWWALALEGGVGIVAGVLAFAWSEVIGMMLLHLIGSCATFIGVLRTVAAVRLRREIDGVSLMGLAGLLSVGVGLTILSVPLGNAMLVMWLIVGAHAITLGLALLALGFRLRSRRGVVMSGAGSLA